MIQSVNLLPHSWSTPKRGENSRARGEKGHSTFLRLWTVTSDLEALILNPATSYSAANRASATWRSTYHLKKANMWYWDHRTGYPPPLGRSWKILYIKLMSRRRTDLPKERKVLANYDYGVMVIWTHFTSLWARCCLCQSCYREPCLCTEALNFIRDHLNRVAWRNVHSS